MSSAPPNAGPSPAPDGSLSARRGRFGPRYDRSGGAGVGARATRGRRWRSVRSATKRYAGTDSPRAGAPPRCPGGWICVFVGPSGSGKTTAMRMVNRMVEITEETSS